ncbi:MAG: hypothetical protein AB8B65_02900 [Kordia sp.]|uniref:hypothetical protein n=1 Tax=Kordia sp. TaxID=1965332 RepID=UPI00385CA16A
MIRITCIILFALITTTLQAQCKPISKDIWNIVQNEDYKKFDNYLMSIEELRKISHWPKSKESDQVIIELRNELRTKLIASVKKLRQEMLAKGFDLNTTNFNRCKLVNEVLTIVVSQNKKEFQFQIAVFQINKRSYIVLPINIERKGLPTFTPTEAELENATIFINGEEFKTIEATEVQKKQGMKILLKECLNGEKVADKDVFFTDGMKAKNGDIILLFIIVIDSKPKQYTINLTKESCKAT